MPLFCCCRSKRTKSPDHDEDAIELPIHLPHAKLSKSQLTTSELELPQSQITVTKAPSISHNQIPEATVDPATLEVEDSDDDEPARGGGNSSTGTLDVIRTKFIRPLSQKSESRRHSQQSLGTSEEEIARRAELKRLMHKRIQEELKSEEEQDEPEVKASHPEELKPVGPSRVAVSGSGPRDNIEFCVSEVGDIGPKDLNPSSQDAALLGLPTSGSQRSTSIRRGSCPKTSSRSHDSSVHDIHNTLKEKASLPQFPSSPQLAPVRLPSTRGSESLYSWRLSYSAEQLANYIGISDDPIPDLSTTPAEPDVQNQDILKGNDEEDRLKSIASNYNGPRENQELPDDLSRNNHGQQQDLIAEHIHDENLDRNSPLDIWLRSQEFQSASIVSSRRNSDMLLQVAPENSNTAAGLNRAGDVDVTEELVHGISHNLPPEEQNSIREWVHPSSLHVETEVNATGLPNSDLLQFHSDGAPDSMDHARETSSYYASSRYTTRPNSRQGTAKESRLSFIELLGGKKAVPPFPNFSRIISPSRTTEAGKSDISSYKTAPNNNSVLDLTGLCEVRQPRRPAAETNSMVVSDTASFREREEELKSVEKRFTQAQPRRDVATPIVSKFKEEFDKPRASMITKTSLFSKLRLTMPRRPKLPVMDTRESNADEVESTGGENMHVTISHPDQQGHEQQATSSNVGSSMKGSAIFREDALEDHRFRESPGSSRVTNQDSNKVSNPKLQIEQDSTLKPPSRGDNNSSHPSDISNSVLREWVNLINDQDSQPQEEHKLEPRSQTPKKLRTPPASWAKWPSHTRAERTGPAGKDDNVIQKDFAVRESNDNNTTWLTDKLGASAKNNIGPSSRTLPAQLGRVMKEGLNRVVRTSSDTFRSRKPRELEYPELEIFPMEGGYKELEALERQIHRMKPDYEAAQSQAVRDSAKTRTKRPLSARLAEDVHMIQHRVLDEQGATSALPAASKTPTRLLLAPQGTSGAGSQSETRGSPVSYEDCVPTHMLEDEPSVDSGTANTEEGPKEGHDTQAT
ncbi:uncharacterized protein F4822DRAFT_267751 [Hypoxylon trugodes]|uniref:uncharacterized protein n=1 Tax=Hypoxylon trugodes TaxID=326681 RepID=UPI00219DE2E8|nr:uncharacterized protein F4822DRAFT_267751 [Hypoxylon trugodes]KAI1389039.1 hypothetical protein F4822DRAFT_267751 [Hypoxylon trugodes]